MNANTQSQHRTIATPSAALVLIPGMLNGDDIWDGVIQGVQKQLGDTVHIRVADVVTQASIIDMARDAWTCFDGISPEIPCFVAGFSMGGYVALEMLTHPARPIREAWLIATSIQPESPESVPMREKTIASCQKDFEKVIYGTARWGTFEKEPEQLEPLVSSMRQLGVDTAIRQTRAIMARRDQRENVKQLTLPVHVFCGEEDRVTPAYLSQELAAAFPNAKLQLVEKSGHMLPFEQPALIAQSMCARLVS